MLPTQWTLDLAVGNKIIDTQNKHLIEMLDDLAQLNYADQASITLQINEFADYLAEHCSLEEDIMKKNNYQNIQAHNAEHAQIIKEVFDFFDEYKTRGSRNQLNFNFYNEFIVNVKEELIQHICFCDREFNSF